MRLARWFVGGAVIALILVMAIAVWVDRASSVQVVVGPAPPREIRAQVSGAVATPGVVRLHADARLIDAIEAAGGLGEDADVTSLNLAGRVGDGEQILIPSIGTGSPGVPDRTSNGTLNINTATIAELDELPGIGDVLAGRIVEYREQNGGFSSVDELSNVDGISPRLVEELRPLVSVEDGS